MQTCYSRVSKGLQYCHSAGLMDLGAGIAPGKPSVRSRMHKCGWTVTRKRIRRSTPAYTSTRSEVYAGRRDRLSYPVELDAPVELPPGSRPVVSNRIIRPITLRPYPGTVDAAGDQPVADCICPRC